MHELFTTAIVKNVQVVETLKILQGLCGMTPVRQLERRIVFEGPKKNPLPGIGPPQLQSRNPANILLWKELNEQLVRQSYYLGISHEVCESHFGDQASIVENNGLSDNKVGINLEELRPTLHFLDYPDPPGTRPANYRLALHIKDEPNLPAFLSQLNYTYSTEFIREAYYAYRENIIFCLSRDLRLPVNTVTGASQGISTTLPAFEKYVSFDGENKWVLTASVEMSDGTPVLLQKGLDQLMQVKQELAGILEFVVVPRRQLDTRVASYMLSIRP